MQHTKTPTLSPTEFAALVARLVEDTTRELTDAQARLDARLEAQRLTLPPG